MQLGACFAGLAIENSMLGAAHGLANPLTAHYGIPHGQAVGLMLPHVIRFNAAAGRPAPIGELLESAGGCDGVCAGTGRRARAALADFMTRPARPGRPGDPPGRLRRGGVRPAGTGGRGRPPMDHVVQSAAGRRGGAVGGSIARHSDRIVHGSSNPLSRRCGHATASEHAACAGRSSPSRSLLRGAPGRAADDSRRRPAAGHVARVSRQHLFHGRGHERTAGHAGAGLGIRGQRTADSKRRR